MHISPQDNQESAMRLSGRVRPPQSRRRTAKHPVEVKTIRALPAAAAAAAGRDVHLRVNEDGTVSILNGRR